MAETKEETGPVDVQYVGAADVRSISKKDWADEAKVDDQENTVWEGRDKTATVSAKAWAYLQESHKGDFKRVTK